jgi:hypothetical protein
MCLFVEVCVCPAVEEAEVVVGYDVDGSAGWVFMTQAVKCATVALCGPVEFLGVSFAFVRSLFVPVADWLDF